MASVDLFEELDSGAAWLVLTGCGIVAFFGVTALYGSTFGLFLPPLQQDLGWTRAQIAFSLTLVTIVSPLLAPVIGWVIDNVPLRPLVLTGILLQSANFAAFGLMGGELWNYYALCLLLVATATGASLLSLAKVVQGWFQKSLGRAMGILFACSAAGAIVHPMVIQAFISHGGWRRAFFAMAAMSLLFGGLAAWGMVRERIPSARRRMENAPRHADAVVSPGSMLALLRDSIWWKLALWNLLFAFGVGCIMIHFAALLQDRGATPAMSALAVSLLGAGGLLGNLCAGWLMDRVAAPRLAVALMLAPMAAALALQAGPRIEVAIALGVVLGVCSGGDGSLSMFLARRYFSAETFGRASATQTVAVSFGGGISPWLSGLLYGATGGYRLSLLLGALAFGLAAVAAWRLPNARGAARSPERSVGCTVSS